MFSRKTERNLEKITKFLIQPVCKRESSTATRSVIPVVAKYPVATSYQICFSVAIEIAVQDQKANTAAMWAQK